MGNPLVSILIPAYNCEQWIRDAIESSLAQTWKNREIIIVDDGSRDSTLHIARSYSSPSVQVISQANAGASAARNRALEVAQGEFLQWLDADDVLHPDKVRLQLEAVGCDSGDQLLSSAWGSFRSRPEEASFRPNALWRDLSPIDWLVLKMEHNLWMAIQSWLVPKAVSDKAGRWNTALLRNNDGEYFDRLISVSSGVRFIHEARSFVRCANFGSVSSQFNISPAKVESIFLSTRLQIELLQSLERTERTRLAGLKLLQRWLIYFYPERPDLIEECQALARALGGSLHEPSLPWKYALIRRLFGWSVAKRCRSLLPQPKEWIKLHGDRFLGVLGR